MAKRLYGVEPIERFKKFIQINETTGCWEFTGYINKGGYGVFKGYDNKNVLAHRFSYEYYVGKISENLEICHKCNHKKCVNYEHMRQDTKSSNCIDKLKAKNHSIQKLSVDEVIEIKKELKHYYRGQINDLAHFYKVSQETISHIKTGKRWSHVEVER